MSNQINKRSAVSQKHQQQIEQKLPASTIGPAARSQSTSIASVGNQNFAPAQPTVFGGPGATAAGATGGPGAKQIAWRC